MVGTLFPVTPVSGEQANPYSKLISNAMDIYMKRQKAKYMPRQQEADIFSKTFGPLAQFANSPLAQGLNEEQADQAREMITQQLMSLKNGGQQNHPISNFFNKMIGHGGNNQSNDNGFNPPSESNRTPGYFRDKDIYEHLVKGAHDVASPGAQGKLMKSNLSGGISSLIGQNPISDWLGGNKKTGENAEFEEWKAIAADRLMRLKGYSKDVAMKTVEQHRGESDKSYDKRIKRLFIKENSGTNYNKDENSPIKSIEQKIARDKKERAQMQGGFKEAPEGSIGLYKNGELFYIPEDKVSEALQEGFSYE